jgi:NADH-quinone oxidoreductase subunit L
VSVTVLAQAAPATGFAPGATALVWLLPALPLVGFAVNVLLGRRLRLLSGWIATLLVAASFAVCVAAFAELLSLDGAERGRVVLRGWEWFAGVSFDLRFDQLSATLALVVTGVGTLIHLYSIGYMARDERPGTYFAWLNLFVASMLLLVLAQNFLVMFLGWEGVGLCSYLLVGFWFTRPDVPPAAKKAFVVNRVGDVGFLLAMFLILAEFGSLDFTEVLGRFGVAVAEGASGATGTGQLVGVTTGTATAIALLLFLACVGKSAQIPLYVWLPDAMVGPTPVSALIHAATMVTAGVYLVARTEPIFEAAPAAQTTVVLIGAATALLGALIAIGQDDIKRILAYSTISQLGYMFIGVGLGPIGAAAGIFLLVTHAFFKAQLFLGAGSVMHACDGDTDVTRFGGLRRAMPVTWATMLLAWLAIIGIPPLAGFWSKDQVLAAAFEHGGVGVVAWAVGVLTAGLTAFYMSRLFFLTFHGRPRWPEGRHPHESPPLMTVPLVALGLLAAAGGLLGLSRHDGALLRFLEPVFATGGEAAAEPVVSELLLGSLVVLISVLAVLWAWFLYGSGRVDWLALRERYAGARRLLAGGLYVDEVYEFFTVTVGRALAAFLAVNVDQRAIDGVVNGVATGVLAGAERGRRVQSGLVRTYAVGVLGGAALLVTVLVVQSIT